MRQENKKYIFFKIDIWSGVRLMTDEKTVWLTLVARKKNPQQQMAKLKAGKVVRTPYAQFQAEQV